MSEWGDFGCRLSIASGLQSKAPRSLLPFVLWIVATATEIDAIPVELHNLILTHPVSIAKRMMSAILVGVLQAWHRWSIRRQHDRISPLRHPLSIDHESRIILDPSFILRQSSTAETAVRSREGGIAQAQSTPPLQHIPKPCHIDLVDGLPVQPGSALIQAHKIALERFLRDLHAPARAMRSPLLPIVWAA
jgi:hypothetical protein